MTNTGIPTNKSPFIWLFMPYVTGIVISKYYHLAIHPYWLIAISLILSLLYCLLVYRRHKASDALAILTFLCLGYTNLSLHTPPQTDLPPEPTTYAAHIEELKETTNSIRLELTLAAPTSPHIQLYIQKSHSALQLQKGNTIYFNASIQPISTLQSTPYGFNYAQYLQDKGIIAQAYCDSLHWTLASNTPTELSTIETLRNHLLSILQASNLPKQELGIVEALTLGYKLDLDKEVRQQFASAGIAHILAVSGLHVGIIYVLLYFFFFRICRLYRFPRLVRILILITLWGYATLTGLSASVVRATVMITFLVFGNLLYRKVYPINSLLVSAFFILLFKPSFLFDVGFQLSYAAVIGIMLLSSYMRLPVLDKIKNKYLLQLAQYFWGLTLVSVAAQVFTLPLTLYYFHHLPVLFLLSNYVVLPCIGVVIYIAVGYLCLSWIPYLSEALAWILHKALYLLHSFVVWVDSIPYSSIDNIRFELWEVVLAYLILAFIAFCFTKFRKAAICVLLFFILLWGIVGFVRDYRDLTHQEIIVYPSRQVPMVSIIEARKHQVWYADSLNINLLKDVERNYKLQPLTTQKLSGIEYLYSCGKRFAIIQSMDSLPDAAHPHKVDYLILLYKERIKAEVVYKHFSTQNIIIGQNVDYRTAKDIERTASDRGIEVHNIRKAGAFSLTKSKK